MAKSATLRGWKRKRRRWPSVYQMILLPMAWLVAIFAAAIAVASKEPSSVLRWAVLSAVIIQAFDAFYAARHFLTRCILMISIFLLMAQVTVRLSGPDGIPALPAFSINRYCSGC